MNFHAAYDSALEYLRRVLVGLDMWANTIAGGQPGDTMSYRAAVDAAAGDKFACIFCRFLDLFQKDHCALTLAADDQQRLLWGEAVRRGEHPL